MISKEFFVKVINELRDLSYIYDEINDIGRKLSSFGIYCHEYEDLIFKILQEVFKDKKNDWLGYYIYDLNFGKNWEEGKVTDREGNDIPLKTAENLYDILMENYVGTV